MQRRTQSEQGRCQPCSLKKSVQCNRELESAITAAAVLAIADFVSSTKPFAIRGIAGSKVARVVRIGRASATSIFLASI
jgi:hypothetical protein